MAELPQTILPTIEKIYGTYQQGDYRRDHLGASVIGTECERSLWLTFRWASKPNFSQRMLRLFETGTREEARILENLNNAGIEVYSSDPETGKQIHYETYGGHYAGNLDAIAHGFEESKVWHVVECKTANTKSFKELCKNGVERSKFEHFCQMQQYMKWAGLERAYYLCVCKETDEIYGERIKFSPEVVKRLEGKAHRAIFSDNMLHTITDIATDFRCRYCPHLEVCHMKRLPEVSCRTCAYADPLEEGGWYCGKDETKINRQKQRDACMHHIFIPDFVPLEQVDADPQKGWIIYTDGIINGPGAVLSRDLQKAIDKIKGSEGAV